MIKKQNILKAKLNAKQTTIVQFPKFYLEFSMIMGVLLLLYIFRLLEYSDGQIFNIIGLLVVCLFKVLPSFNKIILSINIVKYNQASIQTISSAIKNLNKEIPPKHVESILFANSIKLKNIHFSFEKKNILEDFNFEINKGENICILGKSGSGKSTFINLFLGILELNKGVITVDNKKLNTYNQNWFKKIGYVPQEVLLNNDTIINNISFNEENVNERKIKNILNTLGLNEFIKNQYYKKRSIGQNGKLISGGQRQRIGIARSLYSNKEILIFDEATSSLDSKTEQTIFDSIMEIEYLTFIYSTHNRNLIKYADKIIDFDKHSK